MEPIRRYNIHYIKAFTFMSLALFVLMALYYAFLGYKEEIPVYMEISRFIVSVVYIFMIVLCFSEIKTTNLIYMNTFIFLLTVCLIKFYYNSAGLGEFGYAYDSYGIQNFVFTYGDRPLYKFLLTIRSHTRATRNDYAIFIINYFFYNIYPDRTFVVYAIVVFNTICIHFLAAMIYRLQMQLTGSQSISRLTAILVCASPFMIINVVGGLKEVFFMTVVMADFYFIYRLRKKRTMINWIGSLFFACLSIYFRSAIIYMLLMALFVAVTISRKNSNLYLVGVVGLMLITSTVLPYIMQNVLGVSIEGILYTADYRLSQADNSNSLYAAIGPFLAGIIGPYAKLERAGSYAFIHALAIFMKGCFGWFFIRGCYQIIKHKMIDYFPILIFTFYSIYMIVLAGVSFDMRYHMVHVPLYYIIALNFIKRQPMYDIGYLVINVILTAIYCSRQVVYTI